MFKNQFKTAILLATLGGIFLAVGFLIANTTGLIIGLILALAINFFSYWYSDSIVLKLYKVKIIKKEDNIEYWKAVKEVADKAGIPMPKVGIIPSAQPNAFATGRNPKHAAVACTQGIINLLTPTELKGVIAHEISHIKNKDTLIATIAATVATVISFIAMMARFAAVFGGGNDRDGGDILATLALALLSPIIATIIQLAISRSREYLADESAAKIMGTGAPLASALEKIHNYSKRIPMRLGSQTTASLFIANPFSGKSLTSLFSTHPSLEQRLEKLKKF